MNFRAYYFSNFIGKAAINQMKIFMLKVLKQCSISNLFSTLAYKRIKIKLLKKCYILMEFIAAWPYGLGSLSLSA